MNWRYHCKYTTLPEKTVTCQKCGKEYTYPYCDHGPNVHRDTCDECCGKEARRHRQHYNKTISEGLCLGTTSAILLASCIADPHSPMTIEDVANMTGKDARDWQAFLDYLVRFGEWDRLVRMVRGTDRQERTARKLDFLDMAI